MRQELKDKVDLILNRKRNVVAIPPIKDKEEHAEFWKYVKDNLKKDAIFMTSYKGTIYIRLADAMGSPLTTNEQEDIGYPVEYSVSQVMQDYAVCEDGELASNLLLHYKENAEEICRILRADLEHRRFNDFKQ